MFVAQSEIDKAQERGVVLGVLLKLYSSNAGEKKSAEE